MPSQTHATMWRTSHRIALLQLPAAKKHVTLPTCRLSATRHKAGQLVTSVFSLNCATLVCHIFNKASCTCWNSCCQVWAAAECRQSASRHGQWAAGKVGLQCQLCHPHPHLQLHTDAGPGQPVLNPSWRHIQSWTASTGFSITHHTQIKDYYTCNVQPVPFPAS